MKPGQEDTVSTSRLSDWLFMNDINVLNWPANSKLKSEKPIEFVHWQAKR